MKRVKRISAKDYYGDVEITVRVSNTRDLLAGEVNDVVTDLADSAMKAISEARYFKVPISKIKVS